MKKLCLTLALSLILTLSLSAKIFAAGFQLESIGSLNTTGYQYPEWWYSSDHPTLNGITTANSTITITINDHSESVTADEQGNWTFPTTLTTGDHTITLSSDAGSYHFTLHLNSAMPAGVSTPSATTQPVAGNLHLTLLLFFLGLLMLGSGLKLARATNPQ